MSIKLSTAAENSLAIFRGGVGNAMAGYSQKLPALDIRRLQFVICPYLSSITVHQQLIQLVSSGMDHRESRVVKARWSHQRQADDGPWRCCLFLGAQARLFTNKQCLGGTGPQCSTSYLGKKEGKRKGCEPAKSRNHQKMKQGDRQ